MDYSYFVDDFYQSFKLWGFFSVLYLPQFFFSPYSELIYT